MNGHRRLMLVEINLCNNGLVDCIRQLFQGLGHFVVSIVPCVIACHTYASLVGINILSSGREPRIINPKIKRKSDQSPMDMDGTLKRR